MAVVCWAMSLVFGNRSVGKQLANNFVSDDFINPKPLKQSISHQSVAKKMYAAYYSLHYCLLFLLKKNGSKCGHFQSSRRFLS